MLHLVQRTRSMVALLLNRTPLLCERFEGTIRFIPKVLMETLLDAPLIVCTRLIFPSSASSVMSCHALTRAISSFVV